MEALVRWRLEVWLNAGPFPWDTLVVNLVGGYPVDVRVATFQAMSALDPVWRPALVTEFLGTPGTTLLHVAGSLLLMLPGPWTVQALVPR